MLAIKNNVRVAHRDAGHSWIPSEIFHPTTRHLNRNILIGGKIDNSISVKWTRELDGDSDRFEDRFAHVDLNAADLIAGDFELEAEDAVARLDSQCLVAADAVIVDILGDAANAVAAHFGLGAVGVKHPHPCVGHGAGANQDQAVAADAVMPVGDAPGQIGGVGRHGLFKTVDVHVVVSSPVHFGESHGFCRGQGSGTRV